MRKNTAVKAGLATLGAYALLSTVSIVDAWYKTGGEKLNFEEMENALENGRYYGTALLSAGDPLQPVDYKIWKDYVYKQDEKGRWFLTNKTKNPAMISFAFYITKPVRKLGYKLVN